MCRVFMCLNKNIAESLLYKIPRREVFLKRQVHKVVMEFRTLNSDDESDVRRKESRASALSSGK